MNHNLFLATLPECWFSWTRVIGIEVQYSRLLSPNQVRSRLSVFIFMYKSFPLVKYPHDLHCRKSPMTLQWHHILLLNFVSVSKNVASYTNKFRVCFSRRSSSSSWAVTDSKMSKKPGVQPALHKVIMVGSGGVGKSALTLQFMYDEVIIPFLIFIAIKKSDTF